MTDREKLIERFAERLKEAYPFGDRNNPSPAIYYDDFCDIVDEVAAEIIDSIANGVTVQQWISVTERLPDEEGQYLVYMKSPYSGWQDVLRFAKDGRKVDKYDFHNQWKNVWYYYDSEYGYLTVDSVTHWMPLPQPPKGE
jgi:hypothetical protein